MIRKLTLLWKSKYRFHANVKFMFYILRKNYLNKSFIFYRDLISAQNFRELYCIVIVSFLQHSVTVLVLPIAGN
jgi:hypothetical protein